jgi:two-component system chemotaxis response regulator CheY
VVDLCGKGKEIMGYETRKVMVVDDSSVMRQIIKNNLKQLGFELANLLDAEDGEEALGKIGQGGVDLVISDWNMPKMTGIDFLKAVRADDALKELPFLMVTSEADKEKIMEAVQAGVNQYIVKPFNANQLEEKIKEIFPN